MKFNGDCGWPAQHSAGHGGEKAVQIQDLNSKQKACVCPAAGAVAGLTRSVVTAQPRWQFGSKKLLLLLSVLKWQPGFIPALSKPTYWLSKNLEKEENFTIMEALIALPAATTCRGCGVHRWERWARCPGASWCWSWKQHTALLRGPSAPWWADYRIDDG